MKVLFDTNIVLDVLLSREHYTVSEIKEMEFYLPDIKEQQKIADCLSSLDELINAQVKKCELLKTHKKGLMQGLFPSSNEEDYTKSRQNLDTSETIEEISKKAMMLRNHDQ